MTWRISQYAAWMRIQNWKQIKNTFKTPSKFLLFIMAHNQNNKIRLWSTNIINDVKQSPLWLQKLLTFLQFYLTMGYCCPIWIDKLLKMIVGLSKKKEIWTITRFIYQFQNLSIVFIKQSNRLKQIQIQR